MKKIESTSVKYLILQIVAIIIACMIILPLFDMFCCAVIDHTEFVYSVADYIVEPIVVGCIGGTAVWLLEKNKAKKK